MTTIIYGGLNIDDANSEEYLSILSKHGEIVDHYGRNVLMTTDERTARELESELDAQILEDRNEISIKGNTFNTNEGFPELDSELKIEGYESGTEGLYIVDMIGPINPEWRKTIEDIGANVFNYQPNYAYEVVMTPEKAERIENLDFVEWVGPYQPEFKMHNEIEEALDEDIPLSIRMRPDFEISTLDQLDTDLDVLGQEDLQQNGYRLTVDIDSIDDVEDLALQNDVYYISPHVEPELHGEMDIQQLGGGMWFMDDEYETNTDLDPEPREGDPQEPYRKHGDYGAYINQLGYSGEDVTVAVADSGIGDGTVGDAGVEDFTGRVVDGYGFEQEDDWSDGMGHGTQCTGLVSGDTYRGTGMTWDETQDGDMEYYMGQGLAYESELFATKIFDDAGQFLPTDYYPVVEIPAQESDTYIHSNSWGAPTMGEYIETDEIFDQAVRDADRDTDDNIPMVVTSSAGNEGGTEGYEQEIGSPGNAKNVITVGGNQPYNPGLGFENPENMYDRSSRGWTEDNRIKPDVIAPSEQVLTHNTPLDEGGYVSASGTSFGNPLVAGAASIIVDWYEENQEETPSPAMVKSILINTANDMDPEEGDSRGYVPNQDEGWGVADVLKLEYPTDRPIDFMFEDQSSLITTGETDEYHISASDEDEPLKITLTWTDENAEAGDSPALKNNLDLEVETPTGEVIRGNAFDLSGDGVSDDGFTYPDAEVMEDFDNTGDGWDDVNNVQNVYIHPEELEEGTYTINVKGTNVPADANNDGEANQDYALTAYNVPDIPDKYGEINLNMDEYSGEDTVEITLTDYDLIDEGTHTVNITSEVDGELLDEEYVSLEEINPGVFSGQIETSTEDEEGTLFVLDEAEIEAWYLDEDPGHPHDYETDYIDIEPEEERINPGDHVEYTATSYNIYGEEIGDGDITDEVEWSIDEDAEGFWVDHIYVSENEGRWTVTGEYQDRYTGTTFTDEVTLDVVERGPWPEFGHDSRNTALSDFDTSHVDGTVDWSYETEDFVFSCPTVGSDGTIYVGSHDHHAYALNPDGNEKWSFEADHRVFSAPAIGDDGTVYFGSENLHAVTPDGEEEWTYETGQIRSSPVVGEDGTIYVGDDASNINAVNPDGTEKWTYETEGSVVSVPAIDDDGNVYAGSWDGHLYALNPDGTEKWTYELGQPIWASPAIAEDGTIYIGSYDNNLHSVNPDGTENWIFETDSNVLSSAAIGEDGTIYFGSMDSNLYALNPDGTEEWSFGTGAGIWSSPAIGDDGTIYVGSLDNTFYALDADGEKIWDYTTGGQVLSSPAIGIEGEVYVGSHDYNLYAFTGEGAATNEPSESLGAEDISNELDDDVGATLVTSPDDKVSTDPQPVDAIVFNYGENNQTDVPVEATITTYEEDEEVYFDETTIDIEAGDTANAEFEEWAPEEEGDYKVNITTVLEGDEDPTNDYATKNVVVENIHDVGVSEILEPDKEVFFEEQSVEAIVENFGNLDQTDVLVEATITTGDNEEAIGEEEYYDEISVDIEAEETVTVEFENWTPSEIGTYTLNTTTDLEEDEDPSNDWKERTVQVIPKEVEFMVDSIDKPLDHIYQYEEEVMGTVKHVGNYPGEAEVATTIEQIIDVEPDPLPLEDFSDGLPEDWEVEDRDGNENTWSDEYGDFMRVEAQDDHEHDVLWTEGIDCSEASHRVMLEFYSEYGGENYRDLLISTDGGETSRRIGRDVGEGNVSYDITGWASEETEVMIGWEFYSEEVDDETDYWTVDDVVVKGEYLEDEPGYESEVSTPEIEPNESYETELEDWTPAETPSSYYLTMTAGNDEDTEHELTKRIFAEHNYPPDEPEVENPIDEEENVTHSPELEVYVSDPNENEMDVTFYLLDGDGDYIEEEKVTDVESGSYASTELRYLESNASFEWYVEVDDGNETTTSDTWSFYTYEPESSLKSATAVIDAEPPGSPENLNVDWYGEFTGDGNYLQDVEGNVLTWDNSTDDWIEIEGILEGDVQYYTIYRSEDSEGPWDETTEIDTVSADGSEEYAYYDQNRADDGTQWYYAVEAIDHVGNEQIIDEPELEKDVPEIADPDPEDSAEVEGESQTLSIEVISETEEPLWVGFYNGETHELIGEKSGVESGTIEYDWQFDEEDMAETYRWYTVVSYEEYNVRDIQPEEDEEADDGEWKWLYDHDHRTPSDNAVGLNQPGVWYGAMTLDLSDNIGERISEVAYFDYDDGEVGAPAEYVRAHVAAEDEGAPGDWLGSSEEYVPEGAGWVELALEEAVEIEEPGEYWVVMEVNDKGDGRFPMGAIEPPVEDGQYLNHGNPRMPGDWDELELLGIDASWSLEALVTPRPERGWEFYLRDTVSPVADAGEDIEAEQGDTVTLDGTESTDNVGIDEYEWSIEDPTGDVTTLYGMDVEYTLEYALYYDVELTVYDEAGNYDTDSIEIYAIDTEDPVADAGTSDRTRVGRDYILDGTGSTDNVEIVEYEWTIKGIDGEAEDYEETKYGETVDYEFLYPGIYDVTLEVSDAEGNIDTDKISITVDPHIDAFEITSPEEDYEAIEEDTLTVDWEGHGYLGDMTYEVRLNYGDWDDVGTDTDYNFVGLEDGTHVVQVRATDELGNRYTETRIFEVTTIEEKLEIFSPEDRVESLTYEEEFTILGETDPDLEVYINDASVSVDENGEFEYETELIEGQNVFSVVAQYEEENVEETTAYALYLPQISEMQNQIYNLEDEIDTNQDAIEDIENVINKVENDISDLEDELHTEINNLQGQIDDLQSEIDDIQTQIDDLENEHEAELEDLQAQIDELETELEVAEEEVKDLQQRVEELEEETPGFVWISMVLVAAVIAVAIIAVTLYYKKQQ